MLKIRLLQAVCTVAMLGAVPAFAQSNTSQSNTHGSAAAPAEQQAMPDNDKGSAGNGNTASSEKDGLGVSDHSHKTHRTAMTHRNRAMRGSSNAKTDTSQDATIDRLNSQSYQAAQQGQTFTGNGSGNMSGGASTGMSKSGGSGSMANMSGSGSSSNSMSRSGSAANSMGSGGETGNGSAGGSAGGAAASGAGGGAGGGAK